jgi:hypothetical protein
LAFALPASLLLFAASPAWAGPGRILYPAAGTTIVAGESVEVVFAELPDEVREMELLFSVDGGRNYPLRLTSRLDPRPASFTWTVPRVATSAARLRLRVGRNGEEIEAEPSETFTITLPPLAEPAPFRFREGEWWVGDEGPSNTVQPCFSAEPMARPWELSDSFDGLLSDDDDRIQACPPRLPGRESASSRRGTCGPYTAPIGIVTLLAIPKRE